MDNYLQWDIQRRKTEIKQNENNLLKKSLQ